MIGIVRFAKHRKARRVRRPIETAGIDTWAAMATPCPPHEFGQGMDHDISAMFDQA